MKKNDHNDKVPCRHKTLNAYLFKKEHDKAIESVEQAIALNPNGADAYLRIYTDKCLKDIDDPKPSQGVTHAR